MCPFPTVSLPLRVGLPGVRVVCSRVRRRRRRGAVRPRDTEIRPLVQLIWSAAKNATGRPHHARQRALQLPATAKPVKAVPLKARRYLGAVHLQYRFGFCRSPLDAMRADLPSLLQCSECRCDTLSVSTFWLHVRLRTARAAVWLSSARFLRFLLSKSSRPGADVTSPSRSPGGYAGYAGEYLHVLADR